MKKTFTHSIAMLCMAFICTTTQAQVGIGTATPDNSAILEISGATNKGFMLPKVNLSTPPTSPATGLMVWNNNGSYGNGEGIYYYDGSAWQKITIGIPGTVSSVGLTVPAGLSVTGSPITSSGTFAIGTSLNGPLRGNGSGFTTGNLNLASEITGTLGLGNGGTGATTAANARTNLGLGTMATETATNYVNISGTQTVTGAKTFSSLINGTGAGKFTGTGRVYVATSATSGESGMELLVVGNSGVIRHHDPGIGWKDIMINNAGTGNLGIGSDFTPATALHIMRDAQPQLRIQPVGGAGSTTSLPSAIDFWSTFDNLAADQGPRRTATIVARYIGGAWTREALQFHVGITTGSNDAGNLPNERMRINANTNPQIVGSWANLSDQRIKSEIKTIEYGLKEVMQFNPVSYKIHETGGFDYTPGKLAEESKSDIGFLAQEVYKIAPELAFKPENEDKELWGVMYEKLTPILVKAIQEQQAQIDALKKENSSYKSKIDDLSLSMEFIKAQVLPASISKQ